MSDSDIKLVINKNTVRAVHSEQLQAVLQKLGDITVSRASHIESYADLSHAAKDQLNDFLKEAADKEPNTWWADMLPVGGPVMGPFKTRADALAAEADWLYQQNVPTSERATIQILPPRSQVLTEADLT